MNASRDAKGFTLVELIVVAALLATVFGLVVGGLGRPNLGSSVRRSAQDFASRLLAVQSRSLGRREGAALIVAPNSDNARLGTIVLDAVTPAWTNCSVAGGMPPDAPLATSASVALTAGTPAPAGAYKLRFQADNGGQVSPWFAFSAATGTVAFRTSAGQTSGNTIWPRTADQARRAIIAAYPLPSVSGPEMAKLAAIDLRHSGVGEDPGVANGYGRFEGLGSIAVAYEQVGRVGEVMRKVQESPTAADQPIEPTGVIYFLFAPRADILQNRNTLANPQSIWVAINPHTGRVTVAQNVSQTTEDTLAIQAAREKARAGSAIK